MTGVQGWRREMTPCSTSLPSTTMSFLHQLSMDGDLGKH